MTNPLLYKSSILGRNPSKIQLEKRTIAKGAILLNSKIAQTCIRLDAPLTCFYGVLLKSNPNLNLILIICANKESMNTVLLQSNEAF